MHAHSVSLDDTLREGRALSRRVERRPGAGFRAGKPLGPELPRCGACGELPVRRERGPQVGTATGRMHPDGLCPLCCPKVNAMDVDTYAQARSHDQVSGT